MPDRSGHLLAARSTEALDHALGQVEAYRSWRAFDLGTKASVDERYRALPALTKRLMNLHSPAAFVSGGRSLEQALRDGQIELVTTSGTTDDRILNTWYQPWWDSSERSSFALNGHARRAATGEHREAILVSPLNVGVVSDHPLPLDRRRLGRFLYLNELVDPLAWPDPHYDRMLRELSLFKPAVLEANPSFLSRLCRYARRVGVRPFQPELITLTYEYPSLVHRRQIQAVFDSPLMSSYGTTECAYVFIECEHGRMHQNTDSCRVDLLPFRAERASPFMGLLLVTTFDNPWRALIRFDTGDLGRIADHPCPCGRTEGVTLASIEGRAINLTTTPDGGLVTQADVDRRLASIEGLDEYQLIQTDRRSYALRVGSDADDSAVLPGAEQAMRELYGPGARVVVSPTGGLAPEASGKYRLAKASFTIDPMTFVEPSYWPPSSPELSPRD
ncbi:MAG TPA: hypothetical protein VMK12_31435 [Anaeromyxobacteraceae bacterium]|nr:hypothetical protein [Anaeromyxobacteraceae bacterium]